MAIAWDIKITVLNRAEKRASITAKRMNVDDSDLENIIVLKVLWTFTIETIIDTAEQKLAALDFIWNKWQKYLTQQTAIAEIIGDLENQAKVNLEARET